MSQQYPEQEQTPWGPQLKAYIDAQVASAVAAATGAQDTATGALEAAGAAQHTADGANWALGTKADINHEHYSTDLKSLAVETVDDLPDPQGFTTSADCPPIYVRTARQFYVLLEQDDAHPIWGQAGSLRDRLPSVFAGPAAYAAPNDMRIHSEVSEQDVAQRISRMRTILEPYYPPLSTNWGGAPDGQPELEWFLFGMGLMKETADPALTPLPNDEATLNGLDFYAEPMWGNTGSESIVQNSYWPGSMNVPAVVVTPLDVGGSDVLVSTGPVESSYAVRYGVQFYDYGGFPVRPVEAVAGNATAVFCAMVDFSADVAGDLFGPDFSNKATTAMVVLPTNYLSSGSGVVGLELRVPEMISWAQNLTNALGVAPGQASLADPRVFLTVISHDVTRFTVSHATQSVEWADVTLSRDVIANFAEGVIPVVNALRPITEWLPIYAGTGGAEPTYTVGGPESHSTDWAPYDSKGAFGCYVRREGEMLHFRVSNMRPTVDDPEGAFVLGPDSTDWPAGIGYVPLTVTTTAIFRPGPTNENDSYVPVAVKAHESGIKLPQYQGVVTNDHLGANDCSVLFSLPFYPTGGGL